MLTILMMKTGRVVRMTDKSWKQLERRVARWMGGVRVPLSGANNKFRSGDVDHPSLFIEVKQRANLGFLKWFEKAQEDSEKELKGVPKQEQKKILLVVHEKKSHKVFGMMRLLDICQWDAMEQALNKLKQENPSAYSAFLESYAKEMQERWPGEERKSGN